MEASAGSMTLPKNLRVLLGIAENEYDHERQGREQTEEIFQPVQIETNGLRQANVISLRKKLKPTVCFRMLYRRASLNDPTFPCRMT